MNYLLKLSFFIFVVVQSALTSSITYMEVVVLLLAAASSIYREKFGQHLLLFVLEAAVIFYGATLEPAFSYLLALLAYDLVSCKYYYWIIPIVAVCIHLLQIRELISLIFITGLCCIFSYMKSIMQQKEELYKSSFDKQREYSQQLEQAKAMLLSSAEEAAHMAEIKERNRIARQIHDNVGHSIAGILMQLQAARKLLEKDPEKATGLLDKSIESLADTLVVMRDTVHNIKPAEKLGIEYIRQVIERFTYCPVELRVMGDFSEVPVNIMQIIHYKIKEHLTNISKHSDASKAEIEVSVNSKFVRLLIKDNGTKSGRINEGLGISGMKERVYNVGGTISISNEKGFLIVCLMPVDNSSEVVV